MARMTKEEKRVENEFERYFKLHGGGVQFDVFDLGKIHKEVTAAAKTGSNVEEATKTAIAKYRKN